MEQRISKVMRHNEISFKTQVYSIECLHKNERSHTKNVIMYLTAIEQKEEIITQKRRSPEIVKLRAEINKIETKRTMQRINETRSWFIRKINKLNKPLFKLRKRQKKNNQINEVMTKGML